MNTPIRTMTAGFIALCLSIGGQAAPSRSLPQSRAPRLVDIPAMVNIQVEKALTGTESPEEARIAATGQQAHGGAGGSILALGVAVLLAAVSTMIVLRLVARWQAGATVIRLGLARRDEEQMEPAVAVRDSGIDQQRRPARTPLKNAEEERPFYDSQSFRLLQSFHRGHGELSLAMRLSSDTRGSSTQDKLQRALPHVESDEARATVARKLGLGMGEIDLAAHLQELQTSQLRKEKA